MNLEILPVSLLNQYQNLVSENDLMAFSTKTDSDLSVKNFNFYTSVSAVFSSKIEGEDIDLDSYIKHKRFGISYLPDYTKKIDDLYNAYEFAKKNVLSETTIYESHALLSNNLLPKNQQGKIRAAPIYVVTDDGKIEYVATEVHNIKNELDKFYADLSILLKMELSLIQVFYFASLLHLVFAKIHPFNDGNGRTSRLIEKWFLVSKLGEKAWYIESEKNYYNHHQHYYNSLRALGLEYESLNYEKALPFLLMLPNSLKKQ